MLNLLLTILLAFFFIWGLDKAGVIEADSFKPVMLPGQASQTAAFGAETVGDEVVDAAADISTTVDQRTKLIEQQQPPKQKFTDRIYYKNNGTQPNDL